MFSSTLTILLIGAFLCVIMLLVLSSLLPTGIPGVRQWVWANALMVVAFVLYAFGKSLPPLVAYELADAVNAAASAALLLGFRRFFARPAALAALALGVAAIPVTIGVFHYLIDSFALRTLVVALFQGVIFLTVALTLAAAPKAKRFGYPYLFTGTMAVLVATGHIARGVIYLSGADIPTSLLQPSPWNLFFLSASTLVQPVMTLGAIMMVHDTMLTESERIANRDYLTGAWSRRAFFERAQLELVRSRQTENALSLLLIDVDHFKAINDRFGHATGDQVLVDIVRKGEAFLRSSDCLGRIGGEEFAVLLAGAEGQAARAAAERLQLTLQTRPLPAARGYGGAPYTVSIGLAVLRDSESFEELMQRADAALYRAKAAGRNMVVGEVDGMPALVTPNAAI